MSGELRFPRINNITLSGRLTRDPELRYTPNGSPVVKIPIAFNKVYMLDGEWKEESYFIDVTAWNKLAETSAEKLKKGSPIIVEGTLRTRTYTNKENQNVKIVEINANRIHILEKSDFYQDSTASSQNQNKSGNTFIAEPEVTDDDVPF